MKTIEKTYEIQRKSTGTTLGSPYAKYNKITGKRTLGSPYAKYNKITGKRRKTQKCKKNPAFPPCTTSQRQCVTLQLGKL